MAIGDFTEQADAYQRSRPTYPKTLLDTLIADAKVSEGDPVVDFGAGTGILTRMLLQRRFSVTAIEPNETMRNFAEDLDGVRWLNSTFEASLLKDASQRWAIAAQAFHWADPGRALPEIRRVLQPGCVFTILWNNRANGESDVLGWTENAIRRHVPEFDDAYRDRAWGQVLESTGDFVFLQHRSVRHVISMSQERYLDLWRSHNRLNNIAGPDRFQAFLAELKDFLVQKQQELIEVPYNCDAWSARRSD